MSEAIRQKPCLHLVTSASPGQQGPGQPRTENQRRLVGIRPAGPGAPGYVDSGLQEHPLRSVWYLCHSQALQFLWGAQQMAADDETVGGGRWEAAGAEGALDSLSCSNTWLLTAVCFKVGSSQAVRTHNEQPNECPEPKKQKRSQNCRWEDISRWVKAAGGQ